MTTLTRSIRILIALIFVACLLPGSAQALPQASTTERVSVASDGTEGNNHSDSPAISGNGRFVAFHSYADNLVEGDSNGIVDVFVHDRQTGETTRVSISSDGEQASGCQSEYPDISATGRYVAFNSCAANLVDNDTNEFVDIFVHDSWTGETVRVSVASDGSEANGSSHNAWISGDGRYVAFESLASNLVEGDTNGKLDAFVHDRQTGETTLVSVASDGTPGNEVSASPSLSYAGRYVAFESLANNLVEGDANGVLDIFVHDQQTGITIIVSVASDGTQANQSSWMPAISADGNMVAFETNASNLVEGDTNNVCDTNYDGIYTDNCWDVFVHDWLSGETTRVSVASDSSQATDSSFLPAISGDGRYVTFYSYANDLVSGDTNLCDHDGDGDYDDNCTDVFVHDRTTGVTSRISVASDGTQGNADSYVGVISSDGEYVAFTSNTSNLVAGDLGGWADVFVHGNTPWQAFAIWLPLAVK